MSFLGDAKPVSTSSSKELRISAPDKPIYTARLALDPSTRTDAFSLRYASYLDQGHIETNVERRFEDAYDSLSSCKTVVIYDQLGPVGSVRLCVINKSNTATPAAKAFPGAVELALASLPSGARAAEINRLVRSPAAANDQAVVFLLHRLANYIGYVENVRLMFASVRQNYVSFYKRLGFETVSGLRPYPGLTCPMQLLQCHREDYKLTFAKFPLLNPFAPGADKLDQLMSGESIPLSLLPVYGASRPNG